MYRSRLAFALAVAALAAIVVPSSLPAQITFQRTYGGADGEVGYAVRQTPDSGYVVAGYTKSFGAGRSDIYIIKTDANGYTRWTCVTGGVDDEWGNCVQTITDGGYIVVGYTESFGAGGSDVYLVKTSSAGDTAWTRTFGGAGSDRGWSVAQTTDGGLILAGETNSLGAGGYDAYLVKTNSDGDTAWTRTYGGGSSDFGYAVLQTSDSGYVVAGMTRSFGTGGSDVYLVKTDAYGETLWSRTYGGPSDEEGWSVAQTADGGYIITGMTYGTGNWDAYIVRTDDNGYVRWAKTYGGADYDECLSVRQTADDAYIVGGYTLSFGAGASDVWLIKADASGDTLWTRTFGGAGHDRGYSIQQTADGGYVIAGYTSSFGAGGADVYLIKTDSLGSVAVAEPKASPTRTPGLSLTCEPNPCRGATRISLKPQASSSKPLTLRVYDAQGSRVRTFTVNREPYTVWNGKDDFGHALPSGAYFVRCDIAGQHATTRLVLQR